MRLSEWRAAAPHREPAAGAKIATAVDAILRALGAGPDPHCWIAWGDDPGARYAILVPTDPGLVVCFVRVTVPGEGPRVSAKLVRWNRVSIGELGVEAQAGHRLLSFQVEQQVLRGVDGEADRVAAFALRVIAAIDGRPLPPVEELSNRRRGRAGSAAAPSSPGSARGAGPATGGKGGPPAGATGRSKSGKAATAAPATVSGARSPARPAVAGSASATTTERGRGAPKKAGSRPKP